MTETDSAGGGNPRKPDDAKAAARKSNKPLMEKKRRARINKSLQDLKNLVFQSTKKDNSQYSKLEKADILEAAVKYLRSRDVQHHAGGSPYDVMARYQAGYSECLSEVQRYLTRHPAVSEDLANRIVSHLSSNMAGHPVQPTPIAPAPAPAASTPAVYQMSAMSVVSSSSQPQYQISAMTSEVVTSSPAVTLSSVSPSVALAVSRSPAVMAVSDAPAYQSLPLPVPVPFVATPASFQPFVKGHNSSPSSSAAVPYLVSTANGGFAYLMTSPSPVHAFPVYAAHPDCADRKKLVTEADSASVIPEVKREDNGSVEPLALVTKSERLEEELSGRSPVSQAGAVDHSDPMWRPW